MGIWLHTHTVTTTKISPSLKELVKSLGDVSVQIMPLYNDCGCRTFQTAFQIHFMPEVTEHMAAHSHHYLHNDFPRFGRVD